MKKTLKNIFWILISMATVCTFTACGDDDDDDNGGNNNTTLSADLPATFAVQAKFAGQDFKTIHNRMISAGCKYGARILNEDDEWEFIEKEEDYPEEAHYYSYGDNIIFQIVYNMQEDKVYVIDYAFLSKRQTAWDEFKKAIEDETSFSKNLKLDGFYGRIDTEDDSYFSNDNDYDNDYESKVAFSSFMFSFPVNTIEEITYTSFYQGITTSVGYMETEFGDFGVEKYYRDETYQPNDNYSEPTKKSEKRIRSILKKK